MSYKVIKKCSYMKDINRRLRSLKSSAKRRGFKVNIKKEEYKLWLESGCAYCGKDVLEENGYCLDRIDNSKGYLPDNIAVCCGQCNKAKGTLSYPEFIEMAERIHKHTQKLLSSVDLKQLKRKKLAVENTTKYKNSETINITGYK